MQLIKTLCLLMAKYCGCFALARFLTRNGIVILGWHGVSIADEHTRFPQYFIPPEMLEKRLEFLSKHYQFISLQEAVRQHASGKIKPGQVVLTFDDGLYDFTKAAVPVLNRFRAPGTLYVVSSKIGNGIAHGAAARDIVLRSQQAQGGDSTTVMEPQRAALVRHQQRLETLDEARRYDYLRRMSSEYDVDFEAMIEQRIWNHHHPHELKEIVAAGHDVQVHTHTHTTTVSTPEKVYEEAATCRRLVEEVTGTSATDYCYPSGLWEHSVWKDLEQAGMRSAVTCKTGPNFASTPRLALRRYLDHSDTSQLEFESIVSGWNWLIRVIFNPRRLFEPSVALREGPPYI